MSATDRDAVLRLLARERLSIDAHATGRTTFLSHLGAAPRLIPGPWIGHRELLLALALQNLTPEQRRSLAQAVLVDYDREFGVGRLILRALPSDLPFGGASLSLRPRSQGPHCLYTWALGPAAQATSCEWLLLRAQPEWASEAGPPPLRREPLATLQALDAGVVIFVPSAVAARQIANTCLVGLPYTAHPRFLPLLDGADPTASIALWPDDAVGAASLSRRTAHVALAVDSPEPIRREIAAWADDRGIELREATCPDRLDRPGLARFWEACGRPAILLRGDPTWTGPAEAWLGELGARVELQSESTQLGLF